MKKKLFAGLLMALVTMCVSITAFALTDGDWEFQLLDDEVMITGYLGDGGDVVIPEKIYGAPVTKVKCEIGKKFNNVTSLEYPGTVKEIHNNGVKAILENIVLNEGTEIIDAYCLQNCNKLQSVHLPSTIKKIKERAFEGCESLSSINLHSGIEEIYSGAFSRTAITELDLSVLSDDCIINSSNFWGTFSGCKALKSVKFRPAETEIAAGMFMECTALENVEIPGTVTKIGYDAFYGCTSLSQIILPTSLEIIGPSAFAGTALSEVVIPYGVKELRDGISGTFGNCENLKSLYIPDTVSYMEYGIISKSNNCIIYCSADSYAAKFCKKYNISYLTDKSVNSIITVYYNGTRVSFHEYDQNPELINNRTLVPLRAIFEAMGADVHWDQATQTVTSTRKGVTIKLTIGDSALYKNGKSIPVDVPAQIINGRTMIPVRVIAEAFGADVDWNGNGRAVLINETI